ncbi:hypothetical protein NU688_20390 [Variovorax sp. ZS18.2.2]|uniref:hypothetical protein n=1 Tax=Variovorax sp. ZS18.2.2 TaxID=2971255 RepID=UPI0021512925|nr:hypothetical protein [Variovorax sp. ZS18.2.2]MCR6478527.1 hypothetical protein [Variovorax sp. ZS18.2.2]
MSTFGLATPSRFALGAAWLARRMGGSRPAAAPPPAGGRKKPVPTAARESVDLRQPLRAMSQAQGPMLARLGIDFNLFLPDDPLLVFAIPDELHALIGDIVGVATEVLQPDTTLHVMARIDGGHAVVNWCDTGAGTQRLAAAFSRPASAADDRIRACQAVVSRHGARIYTAPSPLGDGCLTLRFPLQGRYGTRSSGFL